jgi:hypothetical protein
MTSRYSAKAPAFDHRRAGPERGRPGDRRLFAGAIRCFPRLADTLDMSARRLDSARETSTFVLALGADAEPVSKVPGIRIVSRTEHAVLVEADPRLAQALAVAGDYVAIYVHYVDALRAFNLFTA